MSTNKNKKERSAQNTQVSLTVDQVFKLAVQHYQAGNFIHAEQLCQQILNVEPNNANGNSLLGAIIAQRGGEIDTAIQYLQKAIQVNPDNADTHNNLGNALQEIGKLDEAIENYRKALSLNPNNAVAYNNLGNVFKKLGRLEESVECYRQAIFIKIDYVEAHNNLGNVLRESEQFDEAIESYTKVLTLKADDSLAHHNLGLTFYMTGKLNESIASYRQAILINPYYAEAYNNLGNVLQAAGKLEEAIHCFRKALSIKPGYIGHINLGSALMEFDMLDAATGSFRRALSFKPDGVEALYSLSVILQKEDRMEEALAGYMHVLSLKPDYEKAHNSLGGAFLNLGKLDESLTSFRKAISIKPVFPAAHSNVLLVMNYSSSATQEEIFVESLNFGKIIADPVIQRKHFSLKRDTTPRKLKIGYVSPDFRTHSVAYFIAPLIRAHNKQDFEIYCYSNVKTPDEVTELIKKDADHWREIKKLRDDDVTAQIKRDRIDILVDLTGHTGGNRLPIFARKPSPIQVSWLGYPNTTGLKEMDYRITDTVADPIGTGDDFYTEELIRLQGCFLCYQPYENSPEVSEPPCLQSDTVTFGSFNNLAKLTPEMVKVWAEILLQVPNSRLVLKSRHLSYTSVVQRYQEMFAEYGVTTNRIECMAKNPYLEDHLKTYNMIDIALDTSPYNGTTTTCEALWMGVPVVTFLGERHAGRVGASIMRNIGLTDELVGDNIDSYIAKTIALSKDKNKLAAIRKNLRQQMQDSPLCDALSFAQKIEKAYQMMWTNYTGKDEKKD